MFEHRLVSPMADSAMRFEEPYYLLRTTRKERLHFRRLNFRIPWNSLFLNLVGEVNCPFLRLENSTLGPSNSLGVFLALHGNSGTRQQTGSVSKPPDRSSDQLNAKHSKRVLRVAMSQRAPVGTIRNGITNTWTLRAARIMEADLERVGRTVLSLG